MQYPVELNNPQMGTETLSCIKTIYNFHFLVELNNPQMGTETRYQYISDCNQDIAKVELNNPQMGTETVLLFLQGFLLIVLFR